MIRLYDMILYYMILYDSHVHVYCSIDKKNLLNIEYYMMKECIGRLAGGLF